LRTAPVDLTPGQLPRIRSREIAETPIPLPLLDEQRRIAAILDQADDLRVKRRKTLAQSEEFIRADFIRLCQGAAGETNLEDVAEIIMGQSPKGTSYNFDGYGMPLLNGPTEFGLQHPVEVQWTTAPTKLSSMGDILFCVRGATAGRLNWSDKVYCCGRGIAAIRPHDPNDGAFIYACLEASYEYFQAKGVGSTFINISKDELGRFKLPKISVDERAQFSRRTKGIRELTISFHSHLAKLDLLFASLQHRAFRGEL
jgi:type I restriction enzyme S subunit